MKREWTMQTNPTKYEDVKTYTILEPNPDVGKSGVCFSGTHFGVCTLDSRKDAQLISAAPDMYEALLTTDKFLESLYPYVDSNMRVTIAQQRLYTKEAIAKAAGK